MQFKDIYNKVLRECREDTAAPDTDILAIVKDAVNEGYRQVMKDNYIVTDKVIVTVDSNNEFPVSVFTKTLNKIRYILNSDETMNIPFMRSAEDIIRIAPFGNTSIVAYYSYIPADLSGDTDVALLPDRYCEVLIYKGKERYYNFKKKMDMAEYYRNQYESYRGTINNNIGEGSSFRNMW